MNKFSALTAAKFTAMAWPATGKTLHVDASNGSDTKGARGTARAFATLIAAKNAASSGDTIHVAAGSYTVANADQLFKSGVNWVFESGAVVTKTSSDITSGNAYGIFDDRSSGAVTCSIFGGGEFVFNAGTTAGTQNANLRGAVVITNSASVVSFYANKIRISGYYFVSDPTVDAFCACVRIDDSTRVYLDVDALEDDGYSLQSGGVFSGGIPLAWRWGEFMGKVGKIRGNMGAILLWQKSSPSGSAFFDLSVSRVEHYETLHAISILNGTTTQWRSRMRIGSIFGDVDSNDMISVIGGGEHVLDIGEAYSPTAVIAALVVNATAGGNPTVIARFGQVSTPEFALLVGTIATGSPFCRCHIENASMSSTGVVAQLVRGETVLTGGKWKTNNGKGVVHNGGISRICATIDTTTTNAAGNNPISLGAAGCILDGCTLLAPAAADSVTGAFTVKIYGTTYANKAKNAGTTVQAGLGTLVADANVS